MNLLEHYLVEEVSVKDVTDEYCYDISILPLEKYFLVTWIVDCCGIKEEVTNVWREDTYLYFKKQGYYLA